MQCVHTFVGVLCAYAFWTATMDIFWKVIIQNEWEMNGIRFGITVITNQNHKNKTVIKQFKTEEKLE